MKQLLITCVFAIITTVVLSACNPVYADETCITKTFGGVTTTRCKDGGEVTSVCKSREFGGKIITNCK